MDRRERSRGKRTWDHWRNDGAKYHFSDNPYSACHKSPADLFREIPMKVVDTETGRQKPFVGELRGSLPATRPTRFLEDRCPAGFTRWFHGTSHSPHSVDLLGDTPVEHGWPFRDLAVLGILRYQSLRASASVGAQLVVQRAAVRRPAVLVYDVPDEHVRSAYQLKDEEWETHVRRCRYVRPPRRPDRAQKSGICHHLPLVEYEDFMEGKTDDRGCVMTVSSDVRDVSHRHLERQSEHMLRHHGRGKVPMHQVACLKQRATDVLQLAGVVSSPVNRSQMNSVPRALRRDVGGREEPRSAPRSVAGKVNGMSSPSH